MITIFQSLKSISGYPIPETTILEIVDSVGLDPEQDTDSSVRRSIGFKRATAKIYTYLSLAPNVSQGGISYSFTKDERNLFVSIADRILKEIGDEDEMNDANYGYMGENL